MLYLGFDVDRDKNCCKNRATFNVCWSTLFNNKEPIIFPKKNLPFFWIIIIFYFFLPYFLINYGEQYVSSGLTALLFSTMPVMTIIFSVFFLKYQIISTQVAGIAIGFFSLLKILTSQGTRLGYQGFLGVIAILLAAIMHAICYIVTKKRVALLV